MADRDPNYVEPRKKQAVPYFRYAVHNVYNYTLLGGVAAASAMTGNWWLAVAGAGAEVLWMLFGPDSKLLRHFVFDKIHDQRMREAEWKELQAAISALPMEDQQRIGRLEAKRADILRLAADNQSLSGDLLGGELAKLQQIGKSFIDLAVTARKYRDYLQTVDLNQLESSIRKNEGIIEETKDEERRELAQKNLAVLEKRKEKLGEIRQFIFKANAQMDLIENTIRLLADQIVTMRSVQEMGGQLDELMDGVEAVQSTARETAAMFAGTEMLSR